MNPIVVPDAGTDEIREMADRVEAARADLQRTIDRARERQMSWADVGAALGVTKQTAWEKHR